MDAKAASNSYFKKELLSTGTFLGGPEKLFYTVGRDTLELCKKQGLNPEHKVLEHGSGVFRCGWWLLDYLDPGNYYAVEGDEANIKRGLQALPQDLARKLGGIVHDASCDMGLFGTDITYDFVISRSVWTHMCRADVVKCIRSFSRIAGPDTLYLTSVCLTEGIGDNPPGFNLPMTYHNLQWLKHAAGEFGVLVELVPDYQAILNQHWLMIRLADS